MDEHCRDFYEKHCSNQFLTQLLLLGVHTITDPTARFRDMEKESARYDREQMAYDHGCLIFEHALEYGCRAGGNGHHQAQYFSAMIRDFTFENAEEQPTLPLEEGGTGI